MRILTKTLTLTITLTLTLTLTITKAKDEGMTLGGDILSGVISLYRGGEAEMSLHIAHILGEKVRKNIVLGL